MNAAPPPAFADHPKRSFIDVLQMLAQAAGPNGLSIAEMVDRMDERAYALLILLFAIPCLVPALPGAQIIAIPIFLLAGQMLLGRQEPWLPGWLLRLRAKTEWMQAMAGFADKRLRWTEWVARPRLTFAATGLGERLTALVILLASIAIMLPITNTIPSVGITLMSIGLLQRDGLFTLGGMLIGLAWIGLLATLLLGLVLGAAFAINLINTYAPWLLEWFNNTFRN